MTRVVSDRSGERKTRKAQAGVESLARRPGPPGEVSDYAFMEWELAGSPVSIANATQKTFVDLGTATSGFSSLPSLFLPDLTNGWIEWPVSVVGTAALAVVAAGWDDTDADYPGPRIVTLHTTSLYDNLADASTERTIAYDAGSWSTLFFFLGQNESDPGSITGSVYHEMGGAVNLVYASLKIIRLEGPLTLTQYP